MSTIGLRAGFPALTLLAVASLSLLAALLETWLYGVALYGLTACSLVQHPANEFRGMDCRQCVGSPYRIYSLLNRIRNGNASIRNEIGLST
jgi:hypothetical protein